MPSWTIIIVPLAVLVIYLLTIVIERRNTRRW